MRAIYITGESPYEISGCQMLLQQAGLRALPYARELINEDAILIVALSAAPLAGWGEHVKMLFQLKKQTSSRIIAIVPEEIVDYCGLRQVCHPVCGTNGLNKVRFDLLNAIQEAAHIDAKPLCHKSYIKLTICQKQALEYIADSLRDSRDCKEYMYPGSHVDFWHRGQLLKKLGFKNFHHLAVVGSGVLLPLIEENNILH